MNIKEVEHDRFILEAHQSRPIDSRRCGRIVRIELDGIPSLYDALNVYTDFLRGCGFCFDGEVTIEREEE